MSLKQLLRLRLATRIAKSARNDTLFKLIMDIINSNSPLAPGGRGDGGEGDYSSRLADIFSDYPITQYSEVYASVLATIRRIYTPAKILPPHQQQSLAETVYQRSLNLFHLAEYAARGTRYVQVSAIMDSRTTPQCRQMNGRIFALPTLSREASNQHELVKSDDYWANAAYFRGVPTPDIVPSLPPYHYNCRTRIVPYLYGDEYHSFDSLSSRHSLYPKILQDKLQNYDLAPKHLSSIIERANACKWKPGSLDEHFAKHNPDFMNAFSSARIYTLAAKALLQDDSATKCLRLEGDQLILLVFLQIPDSRSRAWAYAVYDLKKNIIRSFYKNKNKDIQNILLQRDIKQMLFEPVLKSKKKEAIMLQSDIDQALAELEELHTLDSYEDAIRMIKARHEDDILTYADSIFTDRSDTLFILLQAGLLSELQITRIQKVDAYILSHAVPPQFDELQSWLRQNPLTI